MKKLDRRVLWIAGLVVIALYSAVAAVRCSVGPKVAKPLKAGKSEVTVAHHPISKLNCGQEFADMNDVQLEIAEKVGAGPVENRAAAELLTDKLVPVLDNSVYKVDTLTHSVPFLTKEAAKLLMTIGENFRDSLLLKGLNPQRLIVTSILRTEEDVRALRRGNVNASENSTHRYATTFDIAYARFDRMDRVSGCVDSYPGQMKMVLAEVLRDLRNEGLCYVKHERRQPCFHITSRK